ncbi:hypothetical protein [Vibrio vulnificus]|nr:hypothetical protein [Vibrio vulnificus]
MPNTKNDQKIQVTPNQKALLVQTVKQLITLNQKKTDSEHHTGTNQSDY